MLLSQQGFYFCFSIKRDFFVFGGNNETSYVYMSFLLAQMKELKKTSTLTKPSPILEGCN